MKKLKNANTSTPERLVKTLRKFLLFYIDSIFRSVVKKNSRIFVNTSKRRLSENIKFSEEILLIKFSSKNLRNVKNLHWALTHCYQDSTKRRQASKMSTSGSDQIEFQRCTKSQAHQTSTEKTRGTQIQGIKVSNFCWTLRSRKVWVSTAMNRSIWVGAATTQVSDCDHNCQWIVILKLPKDHEYLNL